MVFFLHRRFAVAALSRFVCLLALVVCNVTQSRADDHDRNVIRRASCTNSRIQFEREQKGHVAFIGGSITEMNGYRPMVCADLQKCYPETEFTFTAAGISSTCSTTGAFRLDRDVLSKGPVDLFFIEYAVNDDQDAAHSRRDCIRGMEGIIQQCRRHNPKMDIVITYFVNPGMLTMLQNDNSPGSIHSHAAVAERYNISTIHLAREVADRITAGTLTWKEFGGTHPKPPGNRIAADMIARLLDSAASDALPVDAKAVAHAVPKVPLHSNSYSDGRFQKLSSASTGNGWAIKRPDWKSIPGSKRSRFTDIPMLCSTDVGSETTVSFKGKAIGLYVVAGPDAGIVEASIDGDSFRPFDLFHRFSRGLHYPRTVMLAKDLSSGDHVLRLRVSGSSNKKSKGHAIRVMQFAVN